jgi:hypothetical protein
MVDGDGMVLARIGKVEQREDPAPGVASMKRRTPSNDTNVAILSQRAVHVWNDNVCLQCVTAIDR